MEEVRERKQEIRKEIERKIAALSKKEIAQRTLAIEQRLFEFANFLEARIALFYMATSCEVATQNIIKRSYNYNKIVVLPHFQVDNLRFKLMKIDNLDTDLIMAPPGRFQPDPAKCKSVPIECVDIAIVPGISMDEKGGRIGTGDGTYDRLIPDLPATTRKVGLAFEDQIIAQVPMESHDRHVDIIITDKRIIYKI
jgi:5-formyltetrahydrofolate cyclo-ligase